MFPDRNHISQVTDCAFTLAAQNFLFLLLRKQEKRLCSLSLLGEVKTEFRVLVGFLRSGYFPCICAK